MRIQPFVYLEPKTLKEALLMLDEHKDKLRILSGGTETVSLLKLHLIKPQYIMSLKRLSSLRGIQKRDNNIIIGGATTLKELIESPLIYSVSKGIVEAARAVAAPHIQNIGTIAGNILQDSRCLFYNQSEIVRNGLEPCFKLKGNVCRAVKGAKRCFSVYQGDLAPILMAYNAKAKLQTKGGVRTIPIADLFSGNGRQPIKIKKNELLIQIILPLYTGKIGSSYRKLRMRGSIDYPLASVASVIHADGVGNITDARIVIGAVGAAPKLLPNVSSSQRIDVNSFIDFVAQEAFKMAEGVNNQPLPGSYRRKMIKVLAKRSINDSLKNILHGE